MISNRLLIEEFKLSAGHQVVTLLLLSAQHPPNINDGRTFLDTMWCIAGERTGHLRLVSCSFSQGRSDRSSSWGVHMVGQAMHVSATFTTNSVNIQTRLAFWFRTLSQKYRRLQESGEPYDPCANLQLSYIDSNYSAYRLITFYGPILALACVLKCCPSYLVAI